MRKMKRVEDSRTENTYLIMNKHINSYGRLFGATGGSGCANIWLR